MQKFLKGLEEEMNNPFFEGVLYGLQALIMTKGNRAIYLKKTRGLWYIGNEVVAESLYQLAEKIENSEIVNILVYENYEPGLDIRADTPGKNDNFKKPDQLRN